MTAQAPTYFFMHVMKTGGTTFVQHIEANFPPEAVYPGATRGLGRQRAYFMIDELRRAIREGRGAIRIFTGHFPFVANELIDADVTLALLRNPIERTLSFLRHCKQHEARMKHLTLEEIYDDDWMYPLYIHNYQSKLFAMTLDDKLESHLDVIDVDDARLETALANLERVNILGLHERYPEFLANLRDQHGWTITDVPDMRVSNQHGEVPSHLRERIAADNAADMVLYVRAQQLYAQRQRV